jgi:hypothetical protein
MLGLFLLPQLQQDADVVDFLFNSTALRCIIISWSHPSLLPYSPTSGLAEVAATVTRPHTPRFSFLCNVKDIVYVRLLQQSVKELSERIHDAVMGVDEDRLRRVWDEIACRWKVCRITRGSYVEHL